MTFKIQNRLEVLRGNKIVVPGCEPTSAFTSPTLAENRECTSTVVDLADALIAIPEATVVSWRNPRTRFFVLPDGPPPQGRECPCKPASEDWYKILKEAAKPLDFGAREDAIPEGCDGFNFSGCRLNVGEDKSQRLESFDEVANFHRAPDPRLRPNTSPLGGVF